jgi:hypothetical protein
MRRRILAAVFAVLIGAILVTPAAAQFGSIFGDPPRPPSSIPGGRQPPPPPQQQPTYPPVGTYPPPPGEALPDPYGGIQSRPLPPPSGAAVGDPPPRAPAPRLPQATPQPADTSPQPGDEVITEPPSQRIANGAALFSGLDKITGRTISFDVAIGETVQFGALQLTPRACYTRPATETANTDSFIEVDEVTLQGEVRRIFTGWVFAASPGLHAVEHPIYDIWLTDCRNPLVTAERPAAEPPPAAPAPPPPRTQQRSAPQKQTRPPAPQQGFPPIR